MAVYTKINKISLESFLSQYNLGSLISFEGILKGIENTNYKITTENGIYILTLLEKRVDANALPFFVNLQRHLSKYGFNCPIPIENKNNEIINLLSNKQSIIISFLDGYQVDNPEPIHCFQVGEMLSKIQKITKNFNLSRKNTLNLEKWKEIFQKCTKVSNNNYNNLIKIIKE